MKAVQIRRFGGPKVFEVVETPTPAPTWPSSWDGTPTTMSWVRDPWYTYGRITYSDLVAAYGLGTWSGTYTNLRPI